MKITDNVYGFIWQSTTANNCNTYLIDGPTRILIDPGHSSLFDHVHKGLNE
ncbi:MAG: MBL fold metallo-hydrolase, partial [Deltaproteobacteria bacterium]|nr:MBL fold metallo-hydrolase [Deltaproteobacteria bacterium]